MVPEETELHSLFYANNGVRQYDEMLGFLKEPSETRHLIAYLS